MDFGFLSRDGAGRSPRVRRRPARFKAEVTALETKQLLSFALVQTKAEPAVIYPATGKYVPVVVSGLAVEFQVDTSVTPIKINYEALPGPKIARFRVIDEYHRVQPKGDITLTDDGGGVYSFSFTVYLQASRSTKNDGGRQYYVDISVDDIDKSYTSHYVPVQVPISLTDRGPGPKLPPTKTTTTTASAATSTKKAAAAHAATKTTTTTTKAANSSSGGSSISSFFNNLI